MSLFNMKKIARIAITIMVVFAFPLYVFTTKTSAATLTNASMSMDDSRPSNAATKYTLTFQGVTAANVKCIKIQFSDAVVGGSKPTGMTLGAVTVLGTSTYTSSMNNWTPSITDATGLMTFVHATGGTAGNGTIEFSAAITNGSTKEVAYYARFNSYDNVDCATTPRDNAVVSFVYTDGVTVTATVDPTLTFTVAAVNSGTGSINGNTTNITTTVTTVPFGVITTATNKIGAQTLTVSTNAGNGYTVFIRNTQPLTAPGPFTITLHSGTNTAPAVFPAAGTEAFGYTTTSTTLSTTLGATDRFDSNKWAAFATTFGTNEVMYNGGPVNAASEKVGFQLGIAGNTKAGSYTTVVEYSAVPIY